LDIHVSIVIPCFNEEKFIGECLSSIVNQLYPRNLIEVIVVNGNSTDSSVDKIKEFHSKLSNLILLDNPKRITPVGLNIGVKNAKGKIIVILGAHSYIADNFIQNAVKELNQTDADCVGGPITNKGTTFVGKAIALAMQASFGVGNSLFRISNKKQYVDTVAFGAYRKEIFEKIGYFDESLTRNQDFEFNQRIIQSGKKILLTPAISSFYYCRSSLPKLFKQYFLYGFWKGKVVKKNLSFFKVRYQIPALFILTILMLGVGGVFYHFLWCLLGCLLIIYLFLSSSVSIYLGMIKNLKYIPILPFVFATLHIAFGFGLLSVIFYNKERAKKL